MIKKIRNIVETTDTKVGFVFDLIVQSLIVVSIAVFSLETLPNLSAEAVSILFRLEIIIITLFCSEYILRFIVAEKKSKFVFSFWGIVDLLAILPFFLLSFDLIMIRALRLMRLFTILKLGRYSSSISRMVGALKIAKEDLILSLVGALIMLLIASFGIYQFENAAQPDKFSSVFESLWWALATLTTVGYGDVYPITAGGKIFTGFVLVIGLGIVAVPAGIIASALTEAREKLERS
jgi:voltage-gated potassium channel